MLPSAASEPKPETALAGMMGSTTFADNALSSGAGASGNGTFRCACGRRLRSGGSRNIAERRAAAGDRAMWKARAPNVIARHDDAANPWPEAGRHGDPGCHVPCVMLCETWRAAKGAR